ncbi:unnamed protein product [Notodromas monacha]|uniref:Methyltransferase FkbM domain-containing protein n=1 Tax=Notodromas monacha TaxID=399045 RepID=A0A7R9GJB3_9CRUS|nr:unnamed protein product [Notodromas monacha]CAG0922672.1 unnamed protein product [Notodromas monacha]
MTPLVTNSHRTHATFRKVMGKKLIVWVTCIIAAVVILKGYSIGNFTLLIGTECPQVLSPNEALKFHIPLGSWAGFLVRSGKIRDNRDGKLVQNYNLEHPEISDFSEHKQSTALVKIFGGKKGGTYFEVGAFDGEFFANSLMLEREYGWTGILVEPVKPFFESVIRKGRRAAILNSCVSSTPQFEVIYVKTPENGTLHQQSMSAKDGTLPVGGSGLHNVPVECYPLYDILVACNSTKLDALFLDVQGPEYDILTTVPWEYVDIQLEKLN